MDAWLVVYHYFLYDGSVSDILLNYMMILLCSGLLVAPPRPAWLLLSFHTIVTVALQVRVPSGGRPIYLELNFFHDYCLQPHG